MTSLLLLPFFLASLGRPLDIEVRPVEQSFTAVLSGPAAGLSAGAFRGALSLNGSREEVPVSGVAERQGSEWRLPITIRYADVPADWANRFRLGAFDYRLHGSVAGVPLELAGTKRWEAVEVEGDKSVVSRFLVLSSVEVTDFSFLESEARALLSVRNPFSFPLKVASARYRLHANGREVGSGETRGLLLRPSRVSTLSLPVELDHGELVAAAGRALLSRGEVKARLNGALTIRMPGGDVSVPLDLSGGLSLSE